MNDRSDDTIKHPVNVDTTQCTGLTCIPRSIHCPATRIHSEVGNDDELDRIDIENLLDTLAAVALSIAARETTHKQDNDRII